MQGRTAMPTLTIEYATEAERQAILRAASFASEMTTLAMTAPPGTVLDMCETMAVERGRRVLLDILQDSTQARLQHDEQKGGHSDHTIVPVATKAPGIATS